MKFELFEKNGGILMVHYLTKSKLFSMTIWLKFVYPTYSCETFFFPSPKPYVFPFKLLMQLSPRKYPTIWD